MQIEIFVLIDAAENTWIATEESELNCDGEEVTHPTRILAITLDVPCPENITLAAIVPPETLPNAAITMTVK